MKKYYIPIALVSVALGIGTQVLPKTSENTLAIDAVTENQTLGYDIEYNFKVPTVKGDDKLIVRLPEGANKEPFGLYTDDFGQRLTVSESAINGREIQYKDLDAANYHFVYTSFNKNDLLKTEDVFVTE